MNILPSTLTQEKAIAILGKAQYVFAAQMNGVAETATTQEVSDYFDVMPSEIMTTLERHYEEFDGDLVEDDWSPRAVLRLGMLLNCPVARLIRDTVLKIVDAIAASGIKNKIKALFSDINFVGWSNREIAKLLECGKDAVRRTRQEMEEKGEIPTTTGRACRRGEAVYQQVLSATKQSDEKSYVQQLQQREERDGVEEEEYYLAQTAGIELTPRTYSQAELDEAIALAVRDALIARKVELEEAAMNAAQDQLNAARFRADQLQDKNSQLQSALDHLQGLTQLEVKNQQLEQEVQRLQKALEITPSQQWANKDIFNRAAAKALNREVQQFLDKLEPDFHLRILAENPPTEEMLPQAIDLLSRAIARLMPVALDQYQEALSSAVEWKDLEYVVTQWEPFKVNIWNQLDPEQKNKLRSLRKEVKEEANNVQQEAPPVTTILPGDTVTFIGDPYQAQYGCKGIVIEAIYGDWKIQWQKPEPDGKLFYSRQSPEELTKVV